VRLRRHRLAHRTESSIADGLSRAALDRWIPAWPATARWRTIDHPRCELVVFVAVGAEGA
jgi:hypothetical protein